jgi:hypothetical protein
VIKEIKTMSFQLHKNPSVQQPLDVIVIVADHNREQKDRDSILRDTVIENGMFFKFK